MNSSRARSRVLALVVLFVLSGSSARAQSYGPEAQVLTIGAAEFRIEGDDADYHSALQSADGYLRQFEPGTDHYRAPLSLPEGARIARICSWVRDTDIFADVGVTLYAVKLTYGGETPHVQEIGPYVSSSLAAGYHAYCADLDETVRGMRDIDGDGNPDPVAWYVRATLGLEAVGENSLGAVRVTWSRQVSASPASPSFGDVPDTHPFYRFIEALAASGVTGGCGEGNFCPSAPLTRGQMAVFLAKALGLHWAP